MVTYLRLQDIESYEYIELDTVYDIEVESEHCYYLDCGKRILVHNSSKSWSIMQFFLLKALMGEKIIITIARANLTWVKATILKDFQELVETYSIPVMPEINANRQDQVYKIFNAEFAFFGLDYPEKMHGRKQDWTWLNEVMEVDKKSFDQLEMRTSQGMILDYNPYDDSHWVFDLLTRSDVCLIKSTVFDNPFVPESVKKKILSYEPTPYNIEQGTADSYMWEVYGKGNKARLEGAIYTNWDIVEQIPLEANLRGFGLDFGYSLDPTALVELYTYNNEIYLNEVLYETGLTNQEIASRLEKFGVNNELIVADSSEPKSIEEIRRYGFNIKGVIKGADSINYGIDLLKSYKIHITKKSINLEKEFRKYKWTEDRNGKSIGKPVGINDHLCDATRYIAITVLGKKYEISFD